MNKLLHRFFLLALLLIGQSVCAFNKAPFVSNDSFERLNLSVSSLTNNLLSSEKSDDNWLYVSDQVVVSNIYPNPASDNVSFNYIFYDAQTSVKVVVRNVLGSMVGEYMLSAQERQLTIPVERFIPGVYFYTLWVNNKSVVTKKLIIKR
jgi:hypothetical protein